MKLLEINNLAVSFHMGLQGDAQVVKGIERIDVTIGEGELVAVVGASGSGKSLLAHAIMGLLPHNAEVTGTMMYKGVPLDERKQEELRGGEIALIPQSVTYLDPLMKVGPQVKGFKRPITEESVDRCFTRLSLALETKKLYPFELSGGMARRTLVSTALVSDAELIIADEPTPGMAVQDAVQALTMLRDLVNEGKSCILITHDIDLAVEVADRIAVFYEGVLMDVVEAKRCKDPETLQNPYTKALFQALPQHGFAVYSEAEVESFCKDSERYQEESHKSEGDE